MTSPPSWDDDNPADLPTIAANTSALLVRLLAASSARSMPAVADACRWHTAIYAGCQAPVAGYVGRFRGDPGVPELVGYEVGVGATQPDGYPDRVGLWSAELPAALSSFFTGVTAALAQLDQVLAPGQRPTSVDELEAVVGLTALVHGEWLRLHPFANGNGRTGRLWAAFIALRYSVPIFVSVKPRPDDVAYERAGRASMGRPPTFAGDHSTAVAVFGHLLSLALLPPPR